MEFLIVDACDAVLTALKDIGVPVIPPEVSIAIDVTGMDRLVRCLVKTCQCGHDVGIRVFKFMRVDAEHRAFWSMT